MRRAHLPLALVAVLIAAGVFWWPSAPPRDTGGADSAADAGQLAIDRTRARTLRESRTGVEAPKGSPAPVASNPRRPAPGGADPPPEGLSLGVHHGPMRRAPRAGGPVVEPSPNPGWLDAQSDTDAILSQANRSGRAFTFAVLRVRSGADLRALNRSLLALGAVIEGVTGAYVRARVPAERAPLESISGLPGVLGLGAVPPGIKAPPAFVEDMWSRPAGEPVPVFITLMASDRDGGWRRALSRLGVVVGDYDGDLRSYTANLPAAALPRVLAADFVMSVEPVTLVTASHGSAVPVMGVDGFRRYDPAMAEFSGRVGAGIAVGVLDTGLNTSHVDIAGGRASICGANFVDGEDWDLWLDLDGHGTHVFGTIAGAGASDPLLAGMAPGLSHLRFAKVLSAYGSGSTDNIRRGMDYLSGATGCSNQGGPSPGVKPLIVNMSLASSSLAFSGRGVGERKLDSVVLSHSQLYVVAQANRGRHGFSNYGTAKNSLAVGAVDDAGIIAPFSSHGPTADGRLAPNVVGTGVGVTSMRGGGSVSGHSTFNGTSMAAPSVAGVAALLMEAHGDFQNRPALARARLMAGAVRPDAFLGGPGQLPRDNSGGPGAFQNLYGMGLVSARTSILARDEPGGWTIGSASARPDSDSYEYIDIEVPEGAGRLDVVLTWDEQPADTLTRAVLNNLDLWADQGADCGGDACGEHSSRSGVDNVEWLFISDPAPGIHRIKVVPVEVYGESSTAAVAWKILRGTATPELALAVRDISPDAGSEHLILEVSVDASHYVASGTSIHISCVDAGDSRCRQLVNAYRRTLIRVHREDGLYRSEHGLGKSVYDPIMIGEVSAGTPGRVELSFLREGVPAGSLIHITASSWNAGAAGQGVALGAGETEDAGGPEAPSNAPGNDSFANSTPIAGTEGESRLGHDLARASREPGEPMVAANSRTLWYAWRAPASGLFRFKLEDTDSRNFVEAGFALFSGENLVELDLLTEKQGSEISFAAQRDSLYRLRVESNAWDLPPLALKWEAADTRPANDDFAHAETLPGEPASHDGSNEGATIERAEFLGGTAASVWYDWTAPSDDWWRFTVGSGLDVAVLVGENLGDLRLVGTQTQTYTPFHATTHFPAREGERYRIRVAAESAEGGGSPFTLAWRGLGRKPGDVAANDMFADAVGIGGAAGGELDSLFARNTGRTTVEHGEPLETGIATAWWHWTAPSDGRFTWRMDGSGTYRLTVFTGDAPSNLQFVDSLRGGSSLVLDATGDTRYWMAIGRHSRAFDPAGARPTSLRWGPAPANNNRAEATPLYGVAGSAEAELAHATRSFDDPPDVVATDSVWWRWGAPASGWQRFWIEGHPLATILAAYPDAHSRRSIADSERSFLANGRVELHLLARAGHTYDLRVAKRPGVPGEASARLRWEAAEAPAHLAYRGGVTTDSLSTDPAAQGFRSSRNLALSDDGRYLFSTSSSGLFAFRREPGGIDLAPAHRAINWLGTNSEYRHAWARLWWNPHLDRLVALPAEVNGLHSFAIPGGDARILEGDRMTEKDGRPMRIGRCDLCPIGLSPDGRHLYAFETDDLMRVYSVDSPTRFTLLRSVSSVPREDALVAPGIGEAVDMALSPDGGHLYVVGGQGLTVFSRDTASGGLALEGNIPRGDEPDNPLVELGGLKGVAVGGTGDVLFVSGGQKEWSVFDTAVAAFDISTDPSNPSHLGTLANAHVETDLEARSAWSHLVLGRGGLRICNGIAAHADRPALDVFCRSGFYVVAWNSRARALEVSDFAVVGQDDRFGNPVPYQLGYDNFASNNLRRQMAQSPNGAQVYRTTALGESELSHAIHIFERASAMTPVADGGDSTGDQPPAADMSPSFPTSDRPANQRFVVGTAIDPITLPGAAGGDRPLSYSLAPGVPGLSFDPATRRLGGTPAAAGTHAMTYTVADVDGDTDTLTFTITIEEAGEGEDHAAGSLGDCEVGMLVRPGQSCDYPGTGEAFSVDANGRGSFLVISSGSAININNVTFNGRFYDFRASHQGDGVWRIDRIDGSTTPATGGGGMTGKGDRNG